MATVNETYLITDNLLRKIDEILHDLEEFPRHDMAIGGAIFYLRKAKANILGTPQPTMNEPTVEQIAKIAAILMTTENYSLAKAVKWAFRLWDEAAKQLAERKASNDQAGH